MATDFFQRQDEARRNTGRLVSLLVAGLLALIATTYVLIALIWNAVGQGRHHGLGPAQETHFWNPGLFILVAGFTTLVVLGASAVRTVQLREGGGSSVAEGMGGREVFQETADSDERKLLNVVEEMSIASGVPMPRVFVMEGEDGINAFAAGWTPDTAVIGVTRGAIARLSRDELQGVIGHEFSHILNGDMRMNIRLMGLVFGLIALAVAGRVLLEISWYSRPSRNDKDKGNLALAIVLIGVVLLVMGYIGSVFGHLMQAAISRQREFLADASAVQFTRNPAGLAGALKRIGAAGCEVRNARAREASHMFFGESDSPFLSLLATHPPLAERIRRLDPAWDGALPDPREGGEAPEIPGRIPAAAPRPLRQPLPPMLAAAMRNPAAAAAIACALLLDRRDGSVRQAQLAAVSDENLADAIRRVAGEVLAIPEPALAQAGADCAAAMRALPPELKENVMAQLEAMNAVSSPAGDPVRDGLLRAYAGVLASAG